MLVYSIHMTHRVQCQEPRILHIPSSLRYKLRRLHACFAGFIRGSWNVGVISFALWTIDTFVWPTTAR